MSDIAQSIAFGEAMKQNLASIEKELEGLPADHPARVAYDLDRQIVRQHASPFNYETEFAMGLIRQQEAEQQRHSRPESRADAADAAMDDLDRCIKQTHFEQRGGALAVFGTEAKTVDEFKTKLSLEEAEARSTRLDSEIKRRVKSERANQEIRDAFNRGRDPRGGF